MSINIRQETHYRGKDWWQWSVCLDGPDEELNNVDHVIYTLHPTFPTPVRKVYDRSSNFRLDSAGWGEFQIHVEVSFKDGTHESKKHWLKFDYYGAPQKAAEPNRAHRKDSAVGKPTVFVSSSISDNSIIRVIRSVLAEYGLETMTVNDLSPNLPWEKSIELLLRKAIAAIFIISEQPSPYLNTEIEVACAQNVAHIIPILIGRETRLPDNLKRFQSIRVKDPSEVESMARRIADAALL